MVSAQKLDESRRRRRPSRGLKTTGACASEYKANNGALKDAKEKKKDFIGACRALASGVPTPIGGAAPSPAPIPAAAPAPQATSTVQGPKSTQTPAIANEKTSTAPGESACGNGYAHLPAIHTAVQFCDEGQAKARCAGQSVVWVNTKSKTYHYAGANTYGHTKVVAYVCESDAKAEGDRMFANGH